VNVGCNSYNNNINNNYNNNFITIFILVYDVHTFFIFLQHYNNNNSYIFPIFTEDWFMVYTLFFAFLRPIQQQQQQQQLN